MKLFIFRTFSVLFVVLFVFACKKKDNNEIIESQFAPTLYNLKYGVEQNQSFNVYLPKNRHIDSTKVAILIHGDDWTTTSTSNMETYVTYLRKSLPHYAFITLNYRLYNHTNASNAFPTQENDIALAIDFIKNNRSFWNISDKMVLIGNRSGAHLALLHTYKNNADNLIKAVAAISPMTNLSEELSTYPETQLVLEQLLGGTPTAMPLAYQQASPIFYVATAKPTILFHGKQNTQFPYQQTTHLTDSLEHYSIPNQQELFGNHSFNFDGTSKQLIVDEMVHFFNVHNP